MKRTPLKREPRPKQCRVCGETFQPAVGFQKYCGRSCREKAQFVDFRCEQCGETFQNVRSSGRRFCSPACANKFNHRHRKGKRGRFGNGMPKESVVAVCEICKQKFTKCYHRQRYCSKGCSNTGRQIRWRETLGTPLPWGIRSKGEDRCRNCGARATHLHHIVPRSYSRAGRTDVKRNGMPLCFQCHRGWHDRNVILYRGCLRAEEISFVMEIAGGWWLEKNYPLPPHVELLELYAYAKGTERLAPGFAERQQLQTETYRDVPDALFDIDE